SWMLPAVGQGALGLECRADDAVTLDLVRRLNHPPTWYAIQAERAMLRALGGGCQVPIGAFSTVNGDCLTLCGAVIQPDGKRRIEGGASGPLAEAEQRGSRLAGELWQRGAGELLDISFSRDAPAERTPSAKR